MAGIFLLLALCAVMAVASFFAGALPLSMTLSQSQLRLISSIGVGILVGTSLIVIIPEGIEAAASAPITAHSHKIRTLARRSPWTFGLEERDIVQQVNAALVAHKPLGEDGATTPDPDSVRIVLSSSSPDTRAKRDEEPANQNPTAGNNKDETKHESEKSSDTDHLEIPALEVGFSMILGFILMFLIDRLPKHATESLKSGPQPQHFSLDNLSGGGIEQSAADADEEEGFLGSLTPTPKHTKSLATTIGLVIHAAADGIAMGASSATSNAKLGFIIFMAIMIHKAPAAFGLTSVLLRQGLSKRAARGHLIVFSMAAPAGAVSTWLLIKLLGGDHLEGESGMWWTGMLLLFSGGTFLYVAMHAMQADGITSYEQPSGTNGYAEAISPSQRKAKGPEIRDTLATVAGMLLPLLTQFGHHH